jgi:hypothetical protein
MEELTMSKYLWNIYVIAILFILYFPDTLAAQVGSPGLKFHLSLTSAARTQRQSTLLRIEADIRSKLVLNMPISSDRIRSQVREAYAANLTFREWYQSLTPASQKWLRKFLNNVRPEGYTSFNAFLNANGNRTIAKIRDSFSKQRVSLSSMLSEAHRPPSLPFLSKPAVTAPSVPSVLPRPSGSKPFDNIPGSKLIAERSYDGAFRYHFTMPDQSVFLRGVPSNPNTGCLSGNTFMAYPYYCNAYCDACCGPAAAQSVLAWFNTPVRWANGNAATTTDDIQHRLANLMETEDGADYTDPDDLDDVLARNEFRAGKPYCYQKGGGTRSQLHNMLSHGSPVILLEASGGWAHYVTVYGYDVANDLYSLANSEDLHWSTLDHRWSFDAAEDDTAFGLWIVGAKSYSLWSYSDCDEGWDYQFILGMSSTLADSLPKVYYDTFSSDYISTASDPQPLNFYAYLYSRIVPMAKVSSGGEGIPLIDGNTHIIVRSTPNAGPISNNSAGQPIDIIVEVDKSFIETYPEIHCGFSLLGVNGAILTQNQAPCRAQVSATLPTTYQFHYRAPYDSNQRQIDFIIHGGLRKSSWPLGGCLRDNDTDGVCEEVDPDDDNDSIPDVRDNCPLLANPDQRDDNHNGIGFACDRCEQCMDRVRATAKVGVDQVMPHTMCQCLSECGFSYCQSGDNDISPLDDDFIKAIHFLYSKWWSQLFGAPGIPSLSPDSTPPLNAVTQLQVMFREIGEILHFEFRGVDPSIGQRILLNAIFGPRDLGGPIQNNSRKNPTNNSVQ